VKNTSTFDSAGKIGFLEKPDDYKGL